jgi:hypothetical protein
LFAQSSKSKATLMSRIGENSTPMRTKHAQLINLKNNIRLANGWSATQKETQRGELDVDRQRKWLKVDKWDIVCLDSGSKFLKKSIVFKSVWGSNCYCRTN